MSHRDLARNRDFARLWTADAVSQVGSALSGFALPLVAYGLTGSAALAAVPAAAYLVGMVGLLLPAGVVTDRLDRRRVLMAAHAGGLVAFGSLVLAALAGALTLTHLALAALVAGAGTGLKEPAEAAAIRSVVPREQLPTALSQAQARQHVAALAGGPLGGVLYGLARWLPFLADVVSYGIALLQVARVRADLSPAPRPAGASARGELADGLRYVLRRPYFRTLAVFAAALNLVVNAVFYVAVLRLVQGGTSPAAIGLVDALAGAGGILGAVLAPALIARVPTGHLTVVTAWSWVPLLVPLVFWSSPALVGGLLFLGLLLNPAGNAAGASYRTAITPAAMQGRVAAATSFLTLATLPLAPLLGGVLLEHAGGPAATAGLLVAAAATALVPTLSRPLRGVPKPADWPAAPDDTPATCAA
jgi:MFS family permease